MFHAARDGCSGFTLHLHKEQAREAQLLWLMTLDPFADLRCSQSTHDTRWQCLSTSLSCLVKSGNGWQDPFGPCVDQANMKKHIAAAAAAAASYSGFP